MIPPVASAAGLQSRREAALVYSGAYLGLRTYLYVDGFNVYYGVFGKERNWPSATYKLLDITSLAAHIWPTRAPIEKTRYFTALVKPPPYDPQMAVRQQSYLRALRSIGTEVHLGTFKFRRRSVRLVGHTAALTTHSPAVVVAAEAQIGKYDEKGSDVNLATYSFVTLRRENATRRSSSPTTQTSSNRFASRAWTSASMSTLSTHNEGRSPS